uniref:Uncharacterized protein n=1 Tax=Anguilla anguilla TaxID=7936 RepID=A0A0E9W4V0_ANGAN
MCTMHCYFSNFPFPDLHTSS